MIEVIHPGIYCSVQDEGRFGFAKIGIPMAGVMDQFSAHLGNSLLKNQKTDALIEVTFGMAKFKFNIDTFICITGADFSQKLNDDLYYYLFSNLDTYLTIENHLDGGSPYKRNALIDREPVSNEYLRSSGSRITDTANYFINNLFYEVIGNKIEFSDTYENWKIFLAEHGAQGIEQDMGEYDISQGCGVSKTQGIASINLNLTWKMDCFRFKGNPIEFKIKDELPPCDNMVVPETSARNRLTAPYLKTTPSSSIFKKFVLFGDFIID